MSLLETRLIRPDVHSRIHVFGRLSAHCRRKSRRTSALLPSTTEFGSCKRAKKYDDSRLTSLGMKRPMNSGEMRAATSLVASSLVPQSASSASARAFSIMADTFCSLGACTDPDTGRVTRLGVAALLAAIADPERPAACTLRGPPLLVPREAPRSSSFEVEVVEGRATRCGITRWPTSFSRRRADAGIDELKLTRAGPDAEPLGECPSPPSSKVGDDALRTKRVARGASAAPFFAFMRCFCLLESNRRKTAFA
mmetsp:Transcript_20366/g.52878  ORF Transcript_20366/g.52878 Transcript_20366/m.52878 type:complete len:253 (-) Transcript_20366:1590-2348(-)